MNKLLCLRGNPMKVISIKYVPVLLLSFFLSACDKKSAVVDKPVSNQSAPAVEQPLASTAPDNGCASLTPLLALLPETHVLDGAPDTFRGCEGRKPTVLFVKMDIDNTYQYEYNIQVLNGDSPYVESYVKKEAGDSGQESYLRKGIGFMGDEFKVHMGLCKNYFANPIMLEGRNPLIKTVDGMELCVMDNMDGNKAVWNVFAVYKDKYGLTLRVTGVKATALKTADEAAATLLPLFKQFNWKAVVE